MGTIQIKNRWSDAVLFECEAPDNLDSGLHVSHALEKATAEKAYLSGADLRDSDLSGADLRGKNFVGDRPFFTIGPIGSRCDYIQAWLTDAGLTIRAGCFFGTKAEFEAKLTVEHGENKHAQEYRAALVLIDKHAELWTPAVEAVLAKEESEVTL